jgi:hypothetical protein
MTDRNKSEKSRSGDRSPRYYGGATGRHRVTKPNDSKPDAIFRPGDCHELAGGAAEQECHAPPARPTVDRPGPSGGRLHEGVGAPLAEPTRPVSAEAGFVCLTSLSPPRLTDHSGEP